MSKLVFPSWRYHKSLEPKLVHNIEDHEIAAKEGWADSPAYFDKKEVIEEKQVDLILDEAQSEEISESVSLKKKKSSK